MIRRTVTEPAQGMYEKAKYKSDSSPDEFMLMVASEWSAETKLDNLESFLVGLDRDDATELIEDIQLLRGKMEEGKVNDAVIFALRIGRAIERIMLKLSKSERYVRAQRKRNAALADRSRERHDSDMNEREIREAYHNLKSQNLKPAALVRAIRKQVGLSEPTIYKYLKKTT